MRLIPQLLTLTTVLVALAGAGAGPAWSAPTVTEHTAGLSAGAGPAGVAAGTAGDLWFVDDTKPGALGRITTGGALTEYTAGLTRDATFGDLAAGPGGSWFTETSKNKIGRVTPAGTISEFSGAGHDKPAGITAGPDGNLWYTAAGKGGAIVRMTPAGATKEFTAGLTANAGPQDITLGPDGNLWFTEAAGGRIGRITPQGTITEFLAGVGGGTPQDLAPGPDGNVWFTVNGSAPAVGRITPAGTITLFTGGLPLNSAPEGIVAGADGNLHFTDPGANAIGQIAPDGTITTTATGLTAAAGLRGIAAGPDGMVWFAEHDTPAVGQISVAPGAVDVMAADVTSTTGTLTGTVTPNGDATTAYVEWGTTTAYGSQSTPVAVGSGAAAQTFDAAAAGLTPSTTYHARVVATNATGTSHGPDRTFTTTAPGAPSATTRPATGVTAAQAMLHATVNPENTATVYRFEWGTTTAYGSTLLPTTPAVGADGTDHLLADALTGLAPNTTYHFRVVADGNGTTVGADQSFTTAAVAPGAATAAASDVTAAGGVLHAVVEPHNSATAFRFEWGATTAYDAAAPDPDALAGDDDAPHAVDQRLTGLLPNAAYHFRVVATSNAATTFGEDRTFRTAAVAPVTDGSATGDVGPTTATLRATIDPRNSATDWWLEWGPTDAYGNTGPVAAVPAGLAPEAVAGTLTELTPGTTYHARVVARNAGGTTAGPDVTFTTPAAPPEDPPAAVAARPEFGVSVAASVTRGTIRVRLPDGRLTTLGAQAAIPTGSTIDATRGELLIASALNAGGRTQTARFRGAVFRVRQPRTAAGMVYLDLRSRPTGCATTARHATARSARRKKPRPAPTLWGKDDHGRYTTSGRGAAATVRGTQWTVTETCRGTLTKVSQGAVRVFDRGTRRTVTVRAGGHYLARVRR